ncbi:hypothetical protein BBF96_02250 [Anoxybacter fermentans]|uniref:DUF2229 domain-containing protein n=1 Tax=Anoxybacter fermentans TaxID=1323375 RepID=A0A3Q9HNW4_9FIRM|nr:acyl-CoA dehydratase activase-related protein [Anoxybacter fermentans]AZR72316.1 hypothetical protein BBF96_02250 [Anoxybacter fermentans]
MGIRVGIPRCLLYYSFFPGWKSFFEELGAEVVLSPPTNKKILDLGIKKAVGEICLPIKLFFGHVEVLKDKVDYIFVPRIMSIHRKEWICPKFLGLPDMVKAQFKDLPPMIAPDINMRKSRLTIFKGALKAAQPFTKSWLKVMKALYRALQIQFKYENKLKQGKTPIEILENIKLPDPGPDPLVIALLGHPYLIYETFINMDLIRRLRGMGAILITPEMISKRQIKKGAAQQKKDLFWTFNKKILGAANHLLTSSSLDGMILLAAFGCGPDSLINELIERRAKRKGKFPLLSINLDEHSGEAGFITRLEAFIDMIKLRRGC